ncbi:MAG: DUF4129 domain-containing protein [Fimbriimonadaceae bacterium]|nr:DUF4129 domain-containing protein [Fimbriimonadaceae bacterium]
MIVLRQAQRTVSELNWLDYVLAALGTALPLNSVGIALSRPTLGLVFVSASLGGILISYIIHILGFSKQRTRWDAVLYIVIALVAIYGSRAFNNFLPDEGFPRDLLITGILSWMLLLGSYTLWRDSTMLFQAIPGLALFGLIGAFNTYLAAPIVFFIYIVIWGTLFARVHTRAMLRVAQQAGYTDTRAIKDGPWRAMAGTRLALISAIAVGLISFVFGPLVKESMGGLARGIVINIPQPRPPSSTTGAGSVRAAASVRIGNGPPLLSESVVFRAKLDEPRYLRTTTYASYTGNGWGDQGDSAITSIGAAPDSFIDRSTIVSNRAAFESVPFQVRLLDFRLDRLPIPGELNTLKEPTLFDPLADGNLRMRTGAVGSLIEGTAFVPTGMVQPTVSERATDGTLPKHLVPFVSQENIPESVMNLAKEVSAEGRNDYEKANMLMLEIQQRCMYNLRAEGAPRDRDAVEWFLFGDVRQAYCDMFASSMALMARSIGIPSRVASGYYPNQSGTNDGWYELRGADAHMWCELYFRDLGWVVFDPTSGARAVEGGERGLSTETGPWYRRPWFLMILNIVILGGLLLGAWVGVQSYRRQKDVKSRRINAMTAAYLKFVRAMEVKSGRLKRLSETPTEYFEAVKEALGDLADKADTLNRQFIDSFYGAAEMTDESVRSLKNEANLVSKDLWRAA